MSAGASGLPLPLQIIEPTSTDLTDFEFGRKVLQLNPRFYSAQPQFSQWYISSKKNDAQNVIAPLNAKHIKKSNNVNNYRLNLDFKIYPNY